MEGTTAVPESDLSQRDTFVRAKVDLYLERAAECFLSGRYRATLSALDGVWRLDPANREANQLRDHVNEKLHLLARTVDTNWLDHYRANAGRRGEVILVVDQDPRVLMGLIDSLNNYGFSCLGAASFEEAVDALTYCRPSVILSEVNFEDGPRGFDLFRHLRADGASSDPLFIFLVANISKEVEIAGQKLGVEDFIRKPFENDVVVTAVLQALSRHRQAS